MKIFTVVCSDDNKITYTMSGFTIEEVYTIAFNMLVDSMTDLKLKEILAKKEKKSSENGLTNTENVL